MSNYILYLLFFFSSTLLWGQPNTIENNKSQNKLIYKALGTYVGKNNSIKLNGILLEQPDYVYSDSSLFFGDTLGNIPCGYGIKYSEYKDLISIGEYKEGKKHGFGYLLSKNRLYVGEFENDLYFGFGNLYIFRDSTSFKTNMNLLLEGRYIELLDSQKITKQFVGVFSNMDKQKGETLSGKEINFFSSPLSNEITKLSTTSGKFIGGKLTEPVTLEIISKNPEGSSVYFGNLALDKNGYSKIITIHKSPRYYSIMEGNFMSKDSFKGKIISADGTITEGSFRNAEINGFGLRYNEDYCYEGNFLNNLFSGKGKITYSGLSEFSEGSYFEGNWVQGKAESGITYLADTKELIKGSYVNGVLEGKATIIKNGKTTIGNFVNGKKQ